MRHFIETHFGVVLLLACVAGLVVPGLPELPNQAAAIALAFLMFVSCYKLQEGGFSSIRWCDISVFCLLRYIGLPLLVWWLATEIAPDYAVAVFLLTMMPAGVASPAFASIYGGVVAPAFAIAIVTQLITPLLVPALFAITGGSAVTPSPLQLFQTLVLCILLPMGIYALVKKHRPSNNWLTANNKIYSILIISFVIALAVAKQRDVILGNPLAALPPFGVAVACYVLYLVFGWYVLPRTPAERMTYATCSSFNNIALAVSLALLYFPPPVVLFTAAGEVAWACLPMMMRVFSRFFAR